MILPCPALALACPGLACPALPCRALPCLLETYAFRRAAGTGREDPQPDTNPSQLWPAVTCGRLCVELRKEAEGSEGEP